MFFLSIWEQIEWLIFLGGNISLLRFFSFKSYSCPNRSSGWTIFQLVIKWVSLSLWCCTFVTYIILYHILTVDNLILQSPEVPDVLKWGATYHMYKDSLFSGYFLCSTYQLPWLAWEGRRHILMALFYITNRPIESTSMHSLICFSNPFKADFCVNLSADSCPQEKEREVWVSFL